MTFDIKDFYLNTPMKQYKYMHIKLNDLPKDVINNYSLAAKVTADRYNYVEIRRDIYGLPQSVLLAQHLL